ncbi:unnamed protein product [Rotaria sp. Silwood2]|nr:unnamed protein product [Rotaria sp. Silwood2]CAF3005971.1 unnamed protein product [Rotaria sp. Silwood2]CAF3336045.1 unnamed protein product [Rotaria sp. Silwood2]CAF4429912.1 unnamed protein product [Rotaria sp. Silwood2]CAF4441462.1 unnamed protein product [Rotaria sp. Silwood2]
MKHYTNLWILTTACFLPLATTLTTLLPQHDVLHKSSGLIMKYLSEYKPANEVISITISIPVVSDMCYIIPWKAMKKIPLCNTITRQEKNENGRKKTASHNWQQTCLFEILTDSNLTLCRTELELEPIFIQRFGQQWAISTRNETKCHRVTQLEQEEHAMTTNNEITIPPIALLTIDRSTTWSCDHFLLPGIANDTNKLIHIIDNKKLNYDDSKLINLYQTMNNNTQWKKIPYIPGNIQNMIEYLITTTPVFTSTATPWYQHGLAVAVGLLGIIVTTSIILYVKLIRKVKKKTSTAGMITMPSI